jgi:uncharacterized protein
VPFNSIQNFFDPSVQFGLQFEAPEETEDPADGKLPAVSAPSPVPTALTVPEPAAEKPAEPGGAEVVRLDRFRKK